MATAPLRVLHVIDSLDPAGGGPPVIAASLAAAQARLGHEVHILAHRSPNKGGPPDCLEQLAGRGAVRRDELPPPGRLERLLARRAARDLDRRVPDFDVVHLHGVWEPLLRAAAAAARRHSRPYLVLLNGMLDPWSLAQKRWKKRLALRLGYRRMLDGAAALHVGNEDERRLIAPLGLRAPAAVIPNGIALEDVEPLPPADAFAAGRPALADKPYILFLSRLHYKKGLDYLADAFRVVAAGRPDVQLVVAGPDGGARADFERRVAGHGLAGRVHLTGPLYGRDKLAALAGAAAFCLPSRQEGFSMAVLEALACRVPVVISEACHFPEVAAAGAGAVVSLDATAVAAALAAVLADPAAARRMGEAGRALVEERFTRRRAAERSVEVYERVLRR
jgi:glycosyltransferase involved in cell wall biosynthesis